MRFTRQTNILEFLITWKALKRYRYFISILWKWVN